MSHGFFEIECSTNADLQGISKCAYSVMSLSLHSATEDRRLTARCFLSMKGLALSLKLPKFSTKSTSLTTSHNHHLCSRISSSTPVRSKRRLYNHLLIATDAYDVNVSPDKRTILLHEQNTLLDSLKVSHQLSRRTYADWNRSL